MKYKVGDKVKIVQFTETYLDAPEETIGNVGTVGAIRLDQDDHIYRVTFENDPEGWNYKEDQLEHIDGMKNVQVKQLYVLWVSDEGDKKLIPNHEYDDFKSKLREAELLLDNEVLYTAPEDQCEDRIYELQQDIYDLIDRYDTLEGEEVFVVLPKDVIKGVRENKMIDNTDLNGLITEVISINTDEDAKFLYRKLNEVTELTDTMKEAIKLREQYIKGDED